MPLRRARIALAVVVLAALTLAACAGGVSEEERDALARETALAAAAAQRAQLIAALEPLDPLRYHHLDPLIREQGRVPTDAIVWAERARETLRWVGWPAELREHVDQYAEWLDALLDALLANDAAAAGEPSRIVHALAHTFEAALEAWLDGRSVPAPPSLAGLEPPMHRHSADGEMSDGMSMDDEQQHDSHGASQDESQGADE